MNINVQINEEIKQKMGKQKTGFLIRSEDSENVMVFQTYLNIDFGGAM